MPLFGSRKPLPENNGRPAEEQLKFYLGGGPIGDTQRGGRIVKQMLKEKFSIDADAPTCGNAVKIGGLVRLASLSTVFRKAVLTLEGVPELSERSLRSHRRATALHLPGSRLR